MTEPEDQEERVEPGMDLDREEEPQYLRRPKRPEVRRRLDSRKMARLKPALLAATALLTLCGAAWGISHYAIGSPNFVLRDDGLEIRGARYVAASQVRERFASDIGKSIFAVSLENRRASIEQIPWVERADVARLWPDRIRVVLHERMPVAFVRIANSTGGGMMLVDGMGQFLDRPVQASFSFPVVTGISEKQDPVERHRRMALFNALMQALDREGTRYSLDISEVDVSDPENARVIVVDTGILLQLGNGNFLERYKTYLAHVQEWRRDFPKIQSIDLRYERQAVVN